MIKRERKDFFSIDMGPRHSADLGFYHPWNELKDLDMGSM